MDDRRFDDLTKLVGRKASRRAVIKATLAGAVASVFGSSIAQAALSPVKTRPRLCIQSGQPCGRPGVDPSRDCCYKCNSSTHKCCEDIGYFCTQDTDCCLTASGVQPICRDTNSKDSDRRKSCQLPGTLPVNALCTQNSDCASGNCIAGICQQCPLGTSTCGTNCCNSKLCQACVNGVCKSKCGPCQTCDGNGACVSTCSKCQTCTNGICKAKTCGPCQTCNPDTGVCGSTCATCQVCRNNACVEKCPSPCAPCNSQTGVCEPIDCSALDGPCTRGVCNGGVCEAAPIDEGQACVGELGEGTCCNGYCCGQFGGCTCVEVDSVRTCIAVPTPQTGCWADSDCGPGAICGNGPDHATCVPLSCADEPCPNGAICDDGLCYSRCAHCLYLEWYRCPTCTSCNAATGVCEEGCGPDGICGGQGPDGSCCLAEGAECEPFYYDRCCSFTCNGPAGGPATCLPADV